MGTARDHVPALLRAQGFPNYGIYYESPSFLCAGFLQPRRHAAALCQQPALKAGWGGAGCGAPAREGGPRCHRGPSGPAPRCLLRRVWRGKPGVGPLTRAV